MEQTPEPEFRLGDYIKILKRRYLFLVLPFVVLFTGSVGVATLLPPIYVSQGTILIESPQISQEIIAGSVDTAARERIEVIRQRVMTRANLLRIANEFGVFQDEKERPSSSEIVQKMRAATGVSFIGGGGYRGASAIAFKVAFEHRRGDIAARVASEIVTLFMDENVRTRTQIATETTQFLNQEAFKLEKNLADIETKIAEYKQENASSLPENLDIRIGMRERAENRIREADREIKAHQEELRFLDIQLSAYRSGLGLPTVVGAELLEEAYTRDEPAEVNLPPLDELADVELAELRSELDEALIKYSDSHPDVKSLRRLVDLREQKLLEDQTPAGLVFRIERLEEEAEQSGEAGENGRVTEINTEIDALKDELRAALTEPAENSRVLSLEERRFDAERRRASLERKRISAERERAEKEAELNIQSIETKIGIAQERIQSLESQKQVLQGRLDEIEQTILQTPLVDRALKALNRDYVNAQAKYNEVRAKAMQAQIAENVEEASKAERFVLLEPPTVPDEPIKPNRKKLLMLGFLMSAGAGMAGLIGIEFIDGSIRSAGQLETALNVIPLATIPYIVTAKEQRSKVRLRYALVIAVLVFGVVSVGGLHYFYKPIDEIFYKVIDRFA